MTNPAPINTDLFSIIVREDWSVSLNLAAWPVLIILVLIAFATIAWRLFSSQSLKDFQIDSAELGYGNLKLSFKPNDMDRQIAYSIWVELSTRKIGLPIDLDHDVIAEVYDSWYNFFSVTRELIKDIPVSKVRQDSTGKIVSLSIEVLNVGVRPHLTQWQARFRHWYEHHMDDTKGASPQDVQKNFPNYDELCTDLLNVNKRLIRYREKMYELVTGQGETGKQKD